MIAKNVLEYLSNNFQMLPFECVNEMKVFNV